MMLSRPLSGPRSRPLVRSMILAATIMLALPGCTRIYARQGYMADLALYNNIAVGVDNRESVEASLGRPSFVGQFGNSDYYYFARMTKQLAFANPSPRTQEVLHIKFDKNDNVVLVERTGLEKVASISPVGDKTPTLGKERSLFDEIFGNIGNGSRAKAAGEEEQ